MAEYDLRDVHVVMVETTPSLLAYEAVQRARAAGARVTLMTADQSDYGPTREAPQGGLHCFDRVVDVETADLDALAVAVAQLADSDPVSGVLSYSDYYCETASALADRLHLPGSGAATAAAVHKEHLRRLTRDKPYGVAYWEIRRGYAENELDKIPLPAVVKPSAEANSVDVRRADTREELSSAVDEVLRKNRNRRGRPVEPLALVEEFLSGEEISVEAVSQGGRHHVYGLTSKLVGHPPTFVELEHCFPYLDGTPEAVAAAGAVTDLLDTLGFTDGVSHTEVMLCDSGPKIVELNPRQPGNLLSRMVADTSGRDPYVEAIVVAAGRPLPTGQPLSAGQSFPAGRPAAARTGRGLVLLFAPHGGTLREVKGVEAARTCPGVEFVELFYAPGDSVEGPVDNYTSVGRVYASGVDAEDALRSAREAAALIAFEVTDARRGGPDQEVRP